MDQDVLMTLSGALIGAASRVVTSVIESAFQSWLERHDEERPQSAEQERRVSQIYLPTAEEVRALTAHHHQDEQAAAQRRAVGTGSIVLSGMGGAFLIHQAREPMPSLGFGVLLSYLFTNGMIKRLRK